MVTLFILSDYTWYMELQGEIIIAKEFAIQAFYTTGLGVILS